VVEFSEGLRHGSSELCFGDAFVHNLPLVPIEYGVFRLVFASVVLTFVKGLS
jgi:hypothetical protein